MYTYSAFQTPTSEQKTYTDWKWRTGKIYTKQLDRKKKAGVATLILHKIDFKTKAIKSHRWTLHNTQGKNLSRRQNVINIYVPNTGVLKYKIKILGNFKKDIDSNTIIVGDFNTPLSTMHRSSKQNINKDIVELNDVLDLMDLIDIYRNFHSKDHILF